MTDEIKGWFVKDFADGWIYFDNETDAKREVDATGAMMLLGFAPFALPTADSRVTEGMVEEAAIEIDRVYFQPGVNTFDTAKATARSALSAALQAPVVQTEAQEGVETPAPGEQTEAPGGLYEAALDTIADLRAELADYRAPRPDVVGGDPDAVEMAYRAAFEDGEKHAAEALADAQSQAHTYKLILDELTSKGVSKAIIALVERQTPAPQTRARGTSIPPDIEHKQGGEEPVVPDGWQLVPKVATLEMEHAAVARVKPYHDEDWYQIMPKDLFRLAWKALLAAATSFTPERSEP